MLDESGAFRVGGRWHTPGRYIVYAALSFAGAVLEKLVRTRIGSVPRDQQLAEIVIPAPVDLEELLPGDLPGWEDASFRASQDYGDEWYDSRRSACLIVPSAPSVGRERNVLLNQLHPDFARIVVSAVQPMVLGQAPFRPARVRPRGRRGFSPD